MEYILPWQHWFKSIVCTPSSLLLVGLSDRESCVKFNGEYMHAVVYIQGC